MLTDALFEEVLIAPAARKGMNRLQIVSGFATASMADKHMEKLKEFDQRVGIELIVGMPKRGGIERAQHRALQRLATERPYEMEFSCCYVLEGAPVHAKTYCWLSGDKPQIAFMGSANYTLTAFGRSQIEAMTDADAQSAASFYAQTHRRTINCLSDGIESKINLIETKRVVADDGKERINLSLLDRRTGDTPEKSGINWGQRPKRDANQAYINIPADIGNSDFFPERGSPFTVLTDDGFSFIMVRAQDGGKGLHTTQNNALLGEYLRARMGVESGEYVTRQHFDEYGRTDVTFIKIDEETYWLDFRPNMKIGEDVENWD